MPAGPGLVRLPTVLPGSSVLRLRGRQSLRRGSSVPAGLSGSCPPARVVCAHRGAQLAKPRAADGGFGEFRTAGALQVSRPPVRAGATAPAPPRRACPPAGATAMARPRPRSPWPAPPRAGHVQRPKPRARRRVSGRKHPPGAYVPETVAGMELSGLVQGGLGPLAPCGGVRAISGRPAWPRTAPPPASPARRRHRAPPGDHHAGPPATPHIGVSYSERHRNRDASVRFGRHRSPISLLSAGPGSAGSP